MKKKSRIFRIAGLLLVLCFISTVMLSGTFAKYTSTYAGQDTALVARWKFEGNFCTDENSTNLHIWDHKYTENIYEKDGDDYLIAPGVEGEFTVGFSYDADVDANLTFKFEKSGVASSKVPIQYSIDGFDTIIYDLDILADAITDEAETDSTSTITGADGEYVVTDTATLKDDGLEANRPISVNKTVSWRWPYDVTKHDNTKLITAGFLNADGTWTDADDTAIGESSAALNEGELDRDSYVLTLTIKAEQKIPGPTTPTP